MKSASPSSTAAGIGKSKLLSKAAKNPYAAYSSSCEKYRRKIDQGHRLCHSCAHKAGDGMYLKSCLDSEMQLTTITPKACAVCGKTSNALVETKDGGLVVTGQRFSSK